MDFIDDDSVTPFEFEGALISSVSEGLKLTSSIERLRMLKIFAYPEIYEAVMQMEDPLDEHWANILSQIKSEPPPVPSIVELQIGNLKVPVVWNLSNTAPMNIRSLISQIPGVRPDTGIRSDAGIRPDAPFKLQLLFDADTPALDFRSIGLGLFIVKIYLEEASPFFTIWNSRQDFEAEVSERLIHLRDAPPEISNTFWPGKTFRFNDVSYTVIFDPSNFYLESPKDPYENGIVITNQTTCNEVTEILPFRTNISNLVCQRLGTTTSNIKLPPRKCSRFALRMARSLVQAAATRIFAEPEQSLLEIVVNSIDAYQKSEQIGKFGMGFFSFLYWIVGHPKRFLTITSTTNSRNKCTWEATIREDQNQELEVIIRLLSPQSVTGSTFNLNAEQDPFTEEQVDEFKDQLGKLKFNSVARILLNGTAINEVSVYAATVQVTVNQKSIINKDTAGGISLEILLSSLLVPSVSTKTLERSLAIEKKFVVGNQTGDKWSAGKYLLTVTVGGVGVIRLPSDSPIGNRIVIDLPSWVRVPVTRDDILLSDPDTVRIFNLNLDKLLGHLLSRGDITPLEKALNAYVDYTSSSEAQRAVLNYLSEIPARIKKKGLLLVPKDFGPEYRILSNILKEDIFIMSDNFSVSDIEAFFESRISSEAFDTNIFYGRRVTTLPFNFREGVVPYTTMGTIRYLFVDERYVTKRLDTWEVDLSVAYPLEKFIPVTTQIGSKEQKQIETLNRKNDISNTEYTSVWTRVYMQLSGWEIALDNTKEVQDGLLNGIKQTDFTEVQIRDYLELVSNIITRFKIPNYTYAGSRPSIKLINMKIMYRSREKKPNSDWWKNSPESIRNLSYDVMNYILTDSTIIYAFSSYLMVPFLHGDLFPVFWAYYYKGPFNSVMHQLFYDLQDLDSKERTEEWIRCITVLLGSRLEDLVGTLSSAKGEIKTFIDYLRARARVLIPMPQSRRVLMTTLWAFLVNSSNVPLSREFNRFKEEFTLIFTKNSNPELPRYIPIDYQYSYMGTQLIAYTFQQDVDPNTWMDILPELNSMPKVTNPEGQMLEIVLNEGTTREPFGAALTELVQNSADAYRESYSRPGVGLAEGNPRESYSRPGVGFGESTQVSKVVKDKRKLNIEVAVRKIPEEDISVTGLTNTRFKEGDWYAISVTDYVGIPDIGLLSLQIPFFSTKKPGSSFTTGEIGTGFFTIYNIAERVLIRTIRKDSGISGTDVRIRITPLLDKSGRMKDLKYEIFEQPDENSNITGTIIILMARLTPQDLAQIYYLVNYHLSLANIQLPNGERVKILLNGKNKNTELQSVLERTPFGFYSFNTGATSLVETKGIPFRDLKNFVQEVLPEILIKEIANDTILNLGSAAYSAVTSRNRLFMSPDRQDDLEIFMYDAVYEYLLERNLKKPLDIPNTRSNGPAKQMTFNQQVYKRGQRFIRLSTFLIFYIPTGSSITIGNMINRGIQLLDDKQMAEIPNFEEKFRQDLIDVTFSPRQFQIAMNWLQTKNSSDGPLSQIPEKERMKELPMPKWVTPFVQDWTQKFVNKIWEFGLNMERNGNLKGANFGTFPAGPSIEWTNKLEFGTLGQYNPRAHAIQLNATTIDFTTDKIPDFVKLISQRTPRTAEWWQQINANEWFRAWFGLQYPASTIQHELEHAWRNTGHSVFGSHDTINLRWWSQPVKDMTFDEAANQLYTEFSLSGKWSEL